MTDLWRNVAARIFNVRPEEVAPSVRAEVKSRYFLYPYAKGGIEMLDALTRRPNETIELIKKEETENGTQQD